MEQKKLLVLGGTGMAGHIAYLYLKNTGKYQVYNVVFRNKITDDSIVLDITDREAVEQVIKEIRPDIIVNCIGILIRGSKSYPDNAIYVNAYFPHFLKRIADEQQARLIHISTDCVFSGKKGYYTEDDFRDADDIYGRSKALGEIINDKDLTIRTSIIGPELKTDGEGLFHWFMNQEGEVKGFTTAIWGGVTTLELAKAIDAAIEKGTAGLIQLSNGVKINKYDLLMLFKKIWNKDIHIVPWDANGVDKSIARSQRFDYEVPGYEEMLKAQYDWMEAYPSLYSSIYPYLKK